MEINKFSKWMQLREARASAGNKQTNKWMSDLHDVNKWMSNLHDRIMKHVQDEMGSGDDWIDDPEGREAEHSRIYNLVTNHYRQKLLDPNKLTSNDEVWYKPLTGKLMPWEMPE